MRQRRFPKPSPSNAGDPRLSPEESRPTVPHQRVATRICTDTYITIWCIHLLLPLFDTAILGRGRGAYDARPLCLWDLFGLFPLVFTILSVSVFRRFQMIRKELGDHLLVELAVIAHVVDLAIRFDRAPALWDHEYWAMLTEVTFVLAFTPCFLSTRTMAAAEMWFLPLVRLQFGLLYASAAFWKLNTSFFDIKSSCGSLLVLELIGSYVLRNADIDAGLINPSLSNLIAKAAPFVTVVGEATIAAFMLLFGMKQGGSPPIYYERRYRNTCIVLAMCLHTSIFLLPVNSAGGFSLDCMSRFICFFDSAEIAQLVDKAHDSKSVVLTGAFVFLVPFWLAILRSHFTGVGPDAGFIANGLLVAFYILLIVAQHHGKKNHAPAAGRNPSLNTALGGTAVFLLTVSYAFIFPVLGLQQMGASTMYANLRNYGPSNHYLVPTAILGDELLFGGGLVQVINSTCDALNFQVGHIRSTHLFPEPVLRLISVARGENSPSPHEFPVQFFPYCMRIHHSRHQLMDSYVTSRREIETGGSFLPCILPMSTVSMALHEAAKSNEEFEVVLSDAGTSRYVTTETMHQLVVIRTNLSCEVVQNGINGGDCAEDSTALQILEPKEMKGFLSWLVAKLLLPYPRLVNSAEEACIT